MSFDERLERLTERHEATAQSLELFVAENRELSSKIDRLTSVAEVCLDSIKRLERIALSHELRIEDIDERLARLEQRQHPPQ